MRAARELLAELGMRAARERTAPPGRIAWERARVKLRGIALS